MTIRLPFIRLVLRLAPPLLWWALGGLAFCLLNNVFHNELWPNTPAARAFFNTAMLVCFLAVPWLAALTAWRLAAAVDNFFWKALWRFAAILGYGGASLASLTGVFAFLWSD